MPLDIYSDLVETVAEYLARDDLSDQIPDFIRLAEADLGREVGWRFTSKEVTGNFVVDEDFITLPTDTLKAEILVITDTVPGPVNINIVSGQEFNRKLRTTSSSWHPVVARHLGLTLKLAPTPAKDWAYKLWYQAFITKLSAANPTHWLLTNAPDAMLYGALKHASVFLKDWEAKAAYEAEYEPAKRSAKKLEFLARTGGGNLRVTTDIDPGSLPRRV